VQPSLATLENTAEEPSASPIHPEERPSWVARPYVAALVRAAILVAPVAASILTSYLVAKRWPRPGGLIPSLGWLAVMIGVGAVAMLTVGRLSRRFLPLTALLRMTLIFPDRAPNRFGLAIRTGTTRQLERRLDVVRANGLGSTESEAAETLLQLAAALREHDRFTRGHGERVRAYSALVGEEMGLGPDEISKLQWAGLIHDVGKLAVPEQVLNKPGRLTAAEYDLIKTHPAEGMALVGPLTEWLGDWALAVGDHHERWDGGGYPAGLAECEISIAGRIVAVADTFDVITATRSYKPAQSPQWARRELANNAGTQFDPDVVRAFLNVSLGRLRGVMWPLSWIAHIPFFGSAVAAPAAGVAAATVAVVGSSLTGAGLGSASAEHAAATDISYASVLATPGPDTADSTPLLPLDPEVDRSIPSDPVWRRAPAAGAPDDARPGLLGAPVTEGSPGVADPEPDTSVGATTPSFEPEAPRVIVTVPPATDATGSATAATGPTTTSAVSTEPPAPAVTTVPAVASGPTPNPTTPNPTTPDDATSTPNPTTPPTVPTGPAPTPTTLPADPSAPPVVPTPTTTETTTIPAEPPATQPPTTVPAGVPPAGSACVRARSGALRLAGADLSGCDLSGVRLVGADLSNANLNDADLTGARLAMFNLDGASLRNAELVDAVLTGGSMRAVEAQDVDARRVRIDLVEAAGANLTGGRFGEGRFRGVSFAGSRARDADFSSARFDAVSFAGAEFHDASFQDTVLTLVDMSDAVARDANFDGAGMQGIDLRNSDLRGADLSGSDISGGNLDGSDVRGADFGGAQLRDTIGVPSRSEAALFDGTGCPDGSVRSTTCWP